MSFLRFCEPREFQKIHIHYICYISHHGSF